MANRVKTPTIIQMEAVECGAASLSIVMSYYKTFAPLEELRVKCGVSRDGVNAFNILEAAKRYGFEAKGYAATLEELEQFPVPAILFWNHNHFVVLEGFKKDNVYINDPATGTRIISHEDLKKHYSDVALAIMPGEHYIPSGSPPGLIERIWKRLLPFKDVLLFLLLSQVTLLLLGLALPVFTQVFLDQIIGKGITSWAWEFLWLFAGVSILSAAITWVQGSFLNYLRTRIAIRFSADFLWHTLSLPILFFTQRFSSEIIYRMGLNVEVGDVLTSNIMMNGINLLFIGFYAVVMFLYDPLIAAIGIASACIDLLLLWKISKIRMNAYAQLQQEQAKVLGVSFDALRNIETMKATGNDNYFFARIAGLYTKNINAFQEMGVKDVWLNLLSSFSQMLSQILLLTVGIWKVMHGSLTVGMLVALQLLLAAFLKPFSELVGFTMHLLSFKVDLNRLDDVLENKKDPLIADRPLAMKQGKNVYKLKGEVSIRNVTFGYSPLDEPLLDDISLTIKPGEWIALVGPVGSGKSTLAKLASGLYPLWKGEIYYDDTPLRHIPRNVWANSVCYIDQGIFLFEGTVRENITLWNYTVPLEQVKEAAIDACIHDVIMSRPQEYETFLLEDGRNFSEGERQRMEIARAMLHYPTLMIMDESTSALDSITETRIIDNIRKRKCSCLMIAHRLSTIKTCDRILVLDRGRIVQEGTHEELKSQAGIYQDLVLSEEGRL